MDINAINQLIPQIMSTLTPAAVGVGGGVANKVGENLLDHGKQLISTIRERFNKEKKKDGGKALKVLDNFIDDPEEYELNLREKLRTFLQSDPAFFQTLNQIVQQGPAQYLTVAKDGTAEENTLENNLGAGTQSLEVGERAIAKKNMLRINKSE